MLAIRAENLSKTYAGEGAPVTVFTDLSFELQEGVFAAVMGPSGVGKSTLLHLLGGIDSADAGKVEVFGQALEELAPRDRARFRNDRIGFVFQFHHLLPEFTAEENVAFPHRIAGESAAEARRRAAEMLERVGLLGRRDHRPRALSGGEQQRVAIARALARGPESPAGGRADGQPRRRFLRRRLRSARRAASRARDDDCPRHAQSRSRKSL